MCVWVCVYVCRNSNVQIVKFNVLGGNLLVGRPVLSILSTGVVFSRIFHSNATQATILYSVYVSTAYEYNKDNALSERKQNKNPLTVSMIIFIRSPCHLIYQQRYICTRYNKRECLCDWLDTLHTK